MPNPFYEIALIVVVAALGGAIAIRLRQPLIIAFVAIGILIGPSGFDRVSAREEMGLLAELGITLLLFVVGLKLDIQLIRHLGPVAVATGLAQMAVTFAGGVGLSLLMGAGVTAALYIGAALMFSSTVIIVKVLSDRREIDSLHGRIALGVLIVQDIAVVAIMAALGASKSDLADQIALPGWAGPAVILGCAILLGVLMRYVLPRVMHALARSSELMLLFAFAWGMFLATVGDAVGLSRELGAFLGGFSLASSGYREALSVRLTSLRDFLLLFFFVDLGARLSFQSPGRALAMAAVLSLFVLVGKPVLVMAVMGAMGYRRRTSFFAGSALAQISEFSLILVTLGIGIGHVDEQVMGVVTLVALFTITLSAYMITNSQRLFEILEEPLGAFERSTAPSVGADAADGSDVDPDVVVFGLGRLGGRLVKRLKDDGFEVYGVDFDPEAVAQAKRDGVHAVYGDAADAALFHLLPLEHARWVVSSVPDRDLNAAMIRVLHAEGFEGRIAVTAHTAHDAERLLELGAHEVLRPYADAALFAAAILASDLVSPKDATAQPGGS
ncbi:MAG TPA: cation:proton antiporter family protein [Actinomycetota bacterium]|nr:cation:proton antiporter family protein [Actinomycetota bacterium]